MKEQRERERDRLVRKMIACVTGVGGLRTGGRKGRRARGCWAVGVDGHGGQRLGQAGRAGT